MRVLPQQIRRQLGSVLRAWGMYDAHADTTAEMMLETDLRGVDSHGISMLPTYDCEFRSGRLNMRPLFKTVREGPAVALIDADASLGHPVSVHAMNLAVDKCRETGVQVIDVLHNAKPADPAQPVLVAGDPEMATRSERLQHGVPVPDDLMEQLRAVAKSAGVPFVLAP
jgi:LDH2 family malate/lactate/ureidoglycolate dehydrogenase